MTTTPSSRAELELSCGLPPGPDFAELAELAEELGYARVWIFGSTSLWEDPFAHLALAAARTRTVGLGAAVMIPADRHVIAAAASIATIVRLSGGRFRPCFATGYTARMTIGQPPVRLDELISYVAELRGLLAGETVAVDGEAVRMLHWEGMAAARPVEVPIWLGVNGPRGAALAPEVADGIIGPLHPSLPTVTMVCGTVLEPGEDLRSPRVLEAVGPWRAISWHGAYAHGGAQAVDAIPGGAEWRTQLEALAPEGQRHLLTFEGHCTHLTERDRAPLEHPEAKLPGRTEVTGDPGSIREQLGELAEAGFCEVMYQPSGPDVARELRAFAAAHRGR